jgi:phenylacetate-coenzyme A ligase PaaK-like adenylate-forming protein
MAKLTTLGTAVSASAAAAQTGVATNTTPLCRGMNAVVQLNLTGVTGTPTILVQTSPDNVTWTTQATCSVITRSGFRAEITLDNYARLNVSVAGSAGTIDCYLTE